MIKNVKHYVVKVYQGKYTTYSEEEEIQDRKKENIEINSSLIKFCFFDRKIKVSGNSIYQDKGENYSPWIWNGERIESQDTDMQSSNYETKYFCKTEIDTYAMEEEDITISEYVEIKEEEKNETIEVLNALVKQYMSYMGESCRCGKFYMEATRGKIEAMKYALLCINEAKSKITSEIENDVLIKNMRYEKTISTR